MNGLKTELSKEQMQTIRIKEKIIVDNQNKYQFLESQILELDTKIQSFSKLKRRIKWIYLFCFLTIIGFSYLLIKDIPGAILLTTWAKILAGAGVIIGILQFATVIIDSPRIFGLLRKKSN